jgi:hypothetical protein
MTAFQSVLLSRAMRESCFFKTLFHARIVFFPRATSVKRSNTEGQISGTSPKLISTPLYILNRRTLPTAPFKSSGPSQSHPKYQLISTAQAKLSAWFERGAGRRRRRGGAYQSPRTIAGRGRAGHDGDIQIAIALAHRAVLTGIGNRPPFSETHMMRTLIAVRKSPLSFALPESTGPPSDPKVLVSPEEIRTATFSVAFP